MKQVSILFVLCCFCLQLVFITSDYTSGIPIKILEGIDKLWDTQINSGSGSGVYDVNEHLLVPYVAPSRFTGPESLQVLSNKCFMQSFDRWEYQICPFHNITQKRSMGSRATLLGVWGHWNKEFVNVTRLDENDQETTRSVRVFNSMEYIEGTACDDQNQKDGPRTSATLQLLCGPKYSKIEIMSVDHEKFCEYLVKLAVPMPCELLVEGHEEIVV